ncbi:MAG: hypothetical protein IJX85_03845 [Lachnospiraceae bacterium]|nr:hypothetical protein [Lachnospiraceae bacterium]
MEKIGNFFKYIHCNNISVILTHFDKNKQIESVFEFEKILKEKAGNNYSCVLDIGEEKILIYDDCAKEYMGYIYGTVEYGYSRGDIHETKLFIKYAVIEHNVYIGGEKIAYIDSSQQITVEKDGIYVIDKSTKLLMKYSDYVLQWKTAIPVNYTQSYKFWSLMNYLGEPYPQGLIAVSDMSELYHFYRESGEYYGHTRIKRQYEMI